MRFTFMAVLLLLFFNITASAQKTDSLFLAAAITKLQHGKEYTLKVASLMPAEKYSFAPTPEEMTFAKQLLHLSANIGWLTSDYLSGGKSPVTKTDMDLLQKEQIMQVVTRSYDFALKALGQFNGSHLSDTVKFFAGPLSKLQIVNLLNDHQTHHRAQLIVYLRLNGISPPDYTGW